MSEEIKDKKKGSLWPDWQEAMVHTEKGGYWHRRILGRRVRPFSVYHAHWLEVVESPLWVGGRKATLADLHLAVRICACDWREAPGVIRRPGWVQKADFTLRALLGKGQFERWDEYQQDYLSHPHRTPKGSGLDKSDPLGKHGILKKDQTIKCGDVNTSPLPDVLMLVSGLMHLGHLSAREAWMMPYSEAEWLLAGLHFQAGHEGSVSTEHDREFLRGMGVGPWKKGVGGC